MIKDLNLDLSYASHWDELGCWPVVREVVSNAIDASPDGWSFQICGRELVVTNPGVLSISALRIGKSVKANTETAIGRYGEGLKVAMLAQYRNDRWMAIRTGSMCITPTHIEEDGDSVFCAEIKDGLECIDQTIITIEVDDPEMHMANFVLEKDRRILFQNGSDAILQKEEGAPSIVFCRGVLIGRSNALFSYNLANVRTHRDRDSYDNWSFGSEMVKLWAFCDNSDLWERIWRNAATGKEEVLTGAWSGLTDSARRACREAFDQVMGKLKFAVMNNDNVHTRGMVIDGGYTPLNLPHGLRILAQKIGIPTDSDVLNNLMERLNTKTEKPKLTREQRSGLNKMNKRLTAFLGKHRRDFEEWGENQLWDRWADKPKVEIVPWNYLDEEIEGDAIIGELRIRVSYRALEDEARWMPVLVEGLAHILHRSDDFTRSHQNALHDIWMKMYALGRKS